MKLEEIDKLNLENLLLKTQIVINQIGLETYNELMRRQNQFSGYLKKVCEKLNIDPLTHRFNYDTGEVEEIKDADTTKS